MSFEFLKPALKSGRFACWSLGDARAVDKPWRTCTKCDIKQSANEFYSYRSHCRTCTKAAVNEWRRARRANG